MTSITNASLRTKNVRVTIQALFLIMVFLSLVFTAINLTSEEKKHENALNALAQKSPAHQFLVKHWLQCKSAPIYSSVMCYSAIRNSAAINGESFVLQVDAAAREMDLL